MTALICDHCRWEGTEADLFPHPRTGVGVCPTCWRQMFETVPREKWGGLMEAVAPPNPSPRTPKLLIDYTDEEYAIAERTLRARLAHEAAPVFVKTNIKGARQGAFDFLRDEFRVK